MEYWDILDKDGNPTGKRICRDRSALAKGEYHPVVHVWIFHNNRFLIQKRSTQKHPMAGEWAATGGAVISGERPIEAATRELSEELSVKAGENELCFIKRMLRKSSIIDIFSLHRQIDEKKLILQKSEVERVKWVSTETLKDMIKSGEFHNYGYEYFQNIFSLIK